MPGSNSSETYQSDCRHDGDATPELPSEPEREKPHDDAGDEDVDDAHGPQEGGRAQSDQVKGMPDRERSAEQTTRVGNDLPRDRQQDLLRQSDACRSEHAPPTHALQVKVIGMVSVPTSAGELNLARIVDFPGAIPATWKSPDIGHL